jgi:hypothetical protein
MAKALADLQKIITILEQHQELGLFDQLICFAYVASSGESLKTHISVPQSFFQKGTIIKYNSTEQVLEINTKNDNFNAFHTISIIPKASKLGMSFSSGYFHIKVESRHTGIWLIYSTDRIKASWDDILSQFELIKAHVKGYINETKPIPPYEETFFLKRQIES